MELEKEELTKLKVSRRNGIIKIRAVINKKSKNIIEKINKTRFGYFFEMINKIDKLLSRLIKKM